MFRICKAEMKKIFLKPSIFVVTGILILVLAFSSFLYKPNARDNSYLLTAKQIMGSNYNSNQQIMVQDLYNQLNSQSLTNTFSGFNDNLSEAVKIIDYYKNENSIVDELKVKLNNIITSFKDCQQTNYLYNLNHDNPSKSVVEAKLNTLKNTFNSFLAYYNENCNTNQSNEVPRVLVTSETDSNIRSFVIKCVNTFSDSTFPAETKYIDILNQLDTNMHYSSVLNEYINKLIPFIPDKTALEDLEVKLEKVEKILGIEKTSTLDKYTYKLEEGNYTGLYGEIYNFANNNNSKNSEDISTLLTYASKYAEQCKRFLEIVRASIRVDALSQYNNIELNEFLGFENENYYERQEELTKQLYLLDTNTYSFDYANTLNDSQPSFFDINCYDFSFFAMKLCFFIIIVYIISLSATTIAGETSSGTMKMLAIRPFNRKKILGGKLLSIIFIGIILLLVSAITTILIGGLSYSFESTSMLIVFNAKNAIALPSLVVYLFMFIGLIYEMIFFILLSLAISLLFRSQVISVATSLLVYFGTIALNIPLASTPWLRFLPFTNIDLFKYLGGSFISTQSTSYVSALLSSPVAIGANFWFSFIYSFIVMILLTMLSFMIFKKRDIR